MSLSAHLRCAAWLVAGSLAVHELRYVLAFGDEASQRLGDTGHARLTLLMPLVTMALAFVAGRAVVRRPTRSWGATRALLAAAGAGAAPVAAAAEGRAAALGRRAGLPAAAARPGLRGRGPRACFQWVTRIAPPSAASLYDWNLTETAAPT